ncbi:MAG: ATP synthase F0 subunit B [Holophaga sp.]|nr:ATP synthase F0 subunit B [Holophaga sp.]
MIPIALDRLGGMGLLVDSSAAAPKGFMDALPDPMKLDLVQIGFVILLITLLYVFLKFSFFQPVVKVMDEREAAIAAGGAAKADATALIDQRQGEYTGQLRELRAKAFEHRKALAAAASDEKITMLETARNQATLARNNALAELKSEKEAAKIELMAQVDALSESMVQHLLKQA